MMENWQKFDDSHQDDVVSFGDRLYKVSQIQKAFEKAAEDRDIASTLLQILQQQEISSQVLANLNPQTLLFNQGVSSELLSAKNGGWKAGKIRLKCQITVEFLPEETEGNSFY